MKANGRGKVKEEQKTKKKEANTKSTRSESLLIYYTFYAAS